MILCSQCDRKPAGCGNCARAGKECPGYRNELDLMFCHETENTVERLKGESSPSHSSVRSSSVQSSDSESSLVVFRDLIKPSSDDFALAYCYDHHIIQGAQSPGVVGNESILVVLKALGMASLAMDTQSCHLAAQARRYYVDALQVTNTALTSKNDCKKDITLFCVIALSYFESIVGNDNTSIDAWLHHIQGTSMLIELRGVEQLETPDGRALFLMASTCLIAMCLRQRLPMPEIIIKLVDKMVGISDPVSGPIWRTSWCNTRLANLRSDVANGVILSADEIIAQAAVLENEFDAAYANVPPDWQYTILSSAGTPEHDSFPSYTHIYSHSIAAQTWNAMRAGRANLLLLTIGALQSPTCTFSSAEISLRLEGCRARLLKMQMDTLATVPQFLGASAFSGKEPEDAMRSAADAVPSLPMEIFEAGGLAPQHVPMLRTSRGYLLLWNLRMIGELHPPESGMRKTAINMLQLTGKALGMSQAFAHARALMGSEWKIWSPWGDRAKT